MSNLVIQRVATARQKKQFLEFPWTLYRGDPNWIPPLRGDQKELVGYKPHPFYARNSVQTFLAYRGGEVCGRIAAILNQGHIAQLQRPPRLLRLLRVPRRPGGGQRPVRRRAPVVRRPGHPPASAGRPTRR